MKNFHEPNTPPIPNSVDNQTISNKNNRIREIDALRGIVLLGILLVHTQGFFGFGPVYLDNTQNIGYFFYNFISDFLVNRCNNVFNLLFGISFYLILRNPSNTSKKFIWRCIILIEIGLFNKIFYTYDALMWYGICGIGLVVIRHLRPNIILSISILLFLVTIFLAHFPFGNLLIGGYPERYSPNSSILSIITTPIIEPILVYLKIQFNAGLFKTFSFMAYGYWVAKSGFIEKIRSWAKPKLILIFLFIYLLCFIMEKIWFVSLFSRLYYLSGSLFYATFFLYIYQFFPKGMKYLEAYGKMGLTNYSFQGIIGVCCVSLFLLPNRLGFEYILVFFMFIFLSQCLFSYLWLKYFKYGPMEYIWRSLMNLKFSNPFIEREKPIRTIVT